MQNRTPTPRNQRPPIPDFDPVPRKYRHDGWTPERQRAFIDALADTGSVSRAAKRINMSPEGAYCLRRQPGAEGFRAAWSAALDFGVQRLSDIAMDRALDGTPVPVFYRGEQVGERRRYNDRLLMFILRHHNSERYGPLKALPAPGARAAHEGDPASGEEAMAERARAIAAILARYDAKVDEERRARLDGQIVAADFALRQLTHIEMLLEAGGATHALIERVNNMHLGPEDPEWGQAIHTSDLSRALDRRRRAIWAETSAPPRPLLPDYTRAPSHAVDAGADMRERERTRRDAERRMAEAQADWEACATSEAWARRRREGATQG